MDALGALAQVGAAACAQQSAQQVASGQETLRAPRAPEKDVAHCCSSELQMQACAEAAHSNAGHQRLLQWQGTEALRPLEELRCSLVHSHAASWLSPDAEEGEVQVLNLLSALGQRLADEAVKAAAAEDCGRAAAGRSGSGAKLGTGPWQSAAVGSISTHA